MSEIVKDRLMRPLGVVVAIDQSNLRYRTNGMGRRL
jgi:hypothetical protein